jgi:ribosomal protein S18 acetylase RimI-like enzyme
MEEPVNLRQLTSRDAREAAELQRSEVTGPLAELGPAFAGVFYGTALRHGLIHGWCCERSGRLQGFLIGSLDAHRLFARVLVRNPLPLLFHAGASSLRDPRAMRLPLVWARGGSVSFRGPELTFIAVAPGQQGRGIGKRLVRHWESFLAERGVSHYDLSVDASNARAIGFYKGLEFAVCDRFRDSGQDRLRMRKALTLKGTAPSP